MAKVINPLLSGSASGQLGGMMTFDKRGFVRQYVVPSNPKTVGQMAVRDTLGDLQRELRIIDARRSVQRQHEFKSHRFAILRSGNTSEKPQRQDHKETPLGPVRRQSPLKAIGAAPRKLPRPRRSAAYVPAYWRPVRDQTPPNAPDHH